MVRTEDFGKLRTAQDVYRELPECIELMPPTVRWHFRCRCGVRGRN